MEHLDTALTFAIIVAIIIFSVRKSQKIDELSKRVSQLEQAQKDGKKEDSVKTK